MLLRNPALERPTVTQTLVAGFQLLLPGEHASVHRHSQAGIRVLLEGHARMRVGPETLDVQPGDLVVLPAMTAHGHEGSGDEPVLWLDVLDVPTIGFVGATFSDENGEVPQTISRPALHRSLAAAQQMLSVDPHPSLGRTHRYKSDGAEDALPVIRATLHELPGGMVGRPWRSTASTVWAVLEGEGTLTSGHEASAWRKHDVFVTPNWTYFSLSSESGALLVSLSDGALLSALGLYLEAGA
jgi:gentisate 1,2-dioxygenase